MDIQIEALKQACRAFYEREHRTGITVDELIAYKSCVKAVKAVTCEIYANGVWSNTCYGDGELLEMSK